LFSDVAFAFEQQVHIIFVFRCCICLWTRN